MGVFVWILASSHFGPNYLPARPFVGCYLSPEGDPLLLEVSGALRSHRGAAGTFKVLQGKQGPLIEAKGLTVIFDGDHVVFKSGAGEFFWPVSERRLQVVFAPDGDVGFRKAPVESCR